MSVIGDVLKLKEQHKGTWRNKPSWFWYLSLFEEIIELTFALVGLHRHSPDTELAQIAAIALNWLELREE